jgi:hypothetical protein
MAKKKKKMPKWYEERMKAIEEAREITRQASKRYYAAQTAREQAAQGDSG